MTEKLKPCPECGGEAQIVEPVEAMFIACCTKCGLHYRTFTHRDMAVSNWNELTINAQLKPCPFCGGHANLLKGNEFSNEYWHVVCGRCLTETRKVNSPDDAIRLWNRRKDNSHE